MLPGVPQRWDGLGADAVPQDYAMSRLGETAYSKGVVAHSMSTEAREQDLELRAETHRTAGERIANWNRYGGSGVMDIYRSYLLLQGVLTAGIGYLITTAGPKTLLDSMYGASTKPAHRN